MAQNQRRVLEGDHVVFKTDDKSKVFAVIKTRNIYFEKTRLKGEDIVGKQYGTLFEVQQGKLVTVTSSENGASVSSDGALGSGKDNRDLVASGENQKLTQEEILKMKEEGLSGQDIVGKLVEQSETFKTKTEFSQEKYIKKKKKKHMLVFRILPSTSRLLLDTFRHCPAKICNLRADSLSQLLNYSNMMWGCTVAVVESCQGLILGSVMERLGGSGKVLHLYPGNDMNRHVVQHFNFPEDQMKTLYEFPLNKLASLENGTLLPVADPASSTKDSTSVTTEKMLPADCASDETRQHDDKKADAESKDSAMEVDKDGDSESVKEEESEDSEKEETDETATKARGRKKGDMGQKKKKPRISREEQEARRQLKAERLQEAATILREHNLDSLIIATKYDCVSLLLRLLPYVAPSRPVVIFSQHKEPLVECFTAVKEKGLGIQLKLSESWYREYQVLPSRTHPLMSMSGTGGYLLSFTRVTSQQ